MPRVNNWWSRSIDWYSGVREVVWFRAAGHLFVIGFGILLVGSQVILKVLKIEFDFAQVDLVVIALIVVGLLCVYFLTVSIMTSDILELERKLRSSEQRFYFNRGTLFYGTEPGIFTRVPTFQRMLAAIGSRVGDEKANKVFIELGRDAAEDFCRNLQKIHDDNYQRLVGGQRWEAMPQKKKIERWLEYDSQAGWGNFAGRPADQSIVIQVQHFEDLFTGKGGTYFAFFLAGYCLAVLNSIIKSSDGEFREALLDSEPSIDDVVRISYRLR
jgi:hypothetical protein